MIVFLCGILFIQLKLDIFNEFPSNQNWHEVIWSKWDIEKWKLSCGHYKKQKKQNTNLVLSIVHIKGYLGA